MLPCLYIILDAVSDELLQKQKMKWPSIPKKNEVITLKYKINTGSGADYVDCTNQLHDVYTEMCVKFIKKYCFFIVGFNLIVNDLADDPRKIEHYFNEFNILLFIDLNENNNIDAHHPVSAKIWEALKVRGDEIINMDFLKFYLLNNIGNAKSEKVSKERPTKAFFCWRKTV